MNARAASKLVLVVEDDMTFRRDICDLLEESGYSAVAASDGRDAIAWLSSNTAARPRLILLDLDMPGMSGAELHAWLQRQSRLAEIPVLIVSGLPDASEVAARLHAAGVLSKPFLPDDLLGLVHKLAA